MVLRFVFSIVFAFNSIFIIGQGNSSIFKTENDEGDVWKGRDLLS